MTFMVLLLVIIAIVIVGAFAVVLKTIDKAKVTKKKEDEFTID